MGGRRGDLAGDPLIEVLIVFGQKRVIGIETGRVHRVEARGGTVVGVTSVAGDRGRFSNYVYGSAKAGFATYLSGLRNRLNRSGAHVVTVKPGFTDTGMTWGLPGMFLVASPEKVARDILRAVAMGIFAELPEFLARAGFAPGVGPVTSVRFVAALDDVTRFATAHQLESYLGLTPGERSSSQTVRMTGITKAGPIALRRALVQAAWTLLRTQPNDPATRWATTIAARRGRFIAVVALARKLAGILFAMWRDGTPYRPSRSARPADATA